MKSHQLRTLTATAVIVIVFVGMFLKNGIGTLSAPGLGSFSILCPLGALTTMISSHMLVPRAVISLVVMALVVVIFGRAFCGWVCPVPLISRIRNLFAKPDRSRAQKAAGVQATSADDGQADESVQPAGKDTQLTQTASAGDQQANESIQPADENVQPAQKAQNSSSGGCAHCHANCPSKKRGEGVDSRHIMLGGAIVTTLIFGFPVFCFVCPIGLTFAFIALIVNLFVHADITWSLVVVPAILIAEVVLFRKWCHKICPLSAAMSLLSRGANKTFIPQIDDTKCIETAHNKSCGKCGAVCPEKIDPRHPLTSHASFNECIKCNECADACPTKALKLTPFVAHPEPVTKKQAG